MNTIMIYLPIVMAIIGLFMWIKRSWVLKQDAGGEDERDFRLHL
jgi:K(+)-stimulated pyrophosphate-energized sodium pump